MFILFCNKTNDSFTMYCVNHFLLFIVKLLKERGSESEEKLRNSSEIFRFCWLHSHSSVRISFGRMGSHRFPKIVNKKRPQTLVMCLRSHRSVTNFQGTTDPRHVFKESQVSVIF